MNMEKPATPMSIRQSDSSNLSKCGKYLLSIASTTLFTRGIDTARAAEDTLLKGFQTKSGLKFYDFETGSGPTPRYGQMISFNYMSYYRKSPNSPLEMIDTTYVARGNRPFLQKHGNGRLIRGIEEGLHTMRVGGKRRIIVPPSLGFIDIAIGPLPVSPSQRKKLGNIIDLVQRESGELVYDLELVMIANDENDQGYYEDVPISAEELRKVVIKNFEAANTDAADSISPLLKPQIK